MEVFVKIPKKKKITNKTFMIVYLNKVDFSPSQSFFSKKKKGIVEEKARTRHTRTVSLI